MPLAPRGWPLLVCAAASLAGCAEETIAPQPILTATFVTFNTGTTDGLPHDDPPDDGFGSEQAAISDEWYGDGLSWLAAVDAATSFFAEVKPDVVAFQEIFYSGECEAIPEELRTGFVCETFAPGDPTVAQVILGQGYQVACHLGKSDKCIAVRRAFGTLRGCDADLCLDGLDGAEIEGCGSGSRVGRGVIDLSRGGELTVVNVHGSSGFTDADLDCRQAQFEQLFIDLGDGEPAANGERNLIMGDFNTDPARAAFLDWSARRLNELVSESPGFHFVTAVGEDAPPTYANAVNIDHVISDRLEGSCVHPGATPGTQPVASFVYFDHVPAVCVLELF